METIEEATTLGWECPIDPVALHADKVHVWRISLDVPEPRILQYRNLLCPEEQEHSERFRFEKHRRRYIVCHGTLRKILGDYVLCDPARIQYSRNEYGKPVLLCAQSAERVSFNVSHSGGLALVAVAAGQEVGVDIERIDPRIEIMNVASVIFSPGEVSVLARIPEPLRRDAFFSCWTRKEAYIKAKGMGLSMPLNQFDVSLAPTEPAALLATRDDPDEAARWSLFELPIDPGFAATLAIGRKISELRLFQWDVQSM